MGYYSHVKLKTASTDAFLMSLVMTASQSPLHGAPTPSTLHAYISACGID